MDDCGASTPEARMPSVELKPDEVHVYLLEPAEISDPTLLSEYYALMNDAERRKHDRYRFERNRRGCLLTRALVRTTLSRYCPEIEPAAWTFEEAGNGRPELAVGQTPLPLRFNVSRTEGLIACAVTVQRAIGVDVEFIDQRRDTGGIAERCFAEPELRALEAQHADRQCARFYSYWTLKEAYIKARGLGLAIPLRQFAFHLDESGPIRISFDSRLADDPTNWQFALEQPTPRHLLALALERRDRSNAGVRISAVVPLRS
jgi:4'-phosphopantetheinyl transferase